MSTRGMLCVLCLVLPWVGGRPSLAGYERPQPVRVSQALEAGGLQRVLSDVPAYLWRHGCGPTAAGMLMGYWDLQGFRELLPGEAARQTPMINQAITSAASHTDYAAPLDSLGSGLLPDKSQFGGAHTSNSLADFLRTSWSSANNIYGWTKLEDTADGLVAYTDYINRTRGMQYAAAAYNEFWGNFTWSEFVNQIDAGRPLLLVVDTEGDNVSDHYVTAIGYRTNHGYAEYASYDTWSTSIRWEPFRGMHDGETWGIYGATFFNITPEPATAGLMLLGLAIMRRRTPS